MKFLRKNFGTFLAAAVLFITTCNVNSTCIYVVHQPKMPEEANRLKKMVLHDGMAE